MLYATCSVNAGVDSRGKRREQIELLNIRTETHEEYALSRPRGLREALLIVASFLMLFFCLITPDVFCSVAGRRRVTAAGAQVCGGYSRPGKILPAGKFIVCAVHPVVGGLFGENDQEQINNISLGIIDWSIPHTGSPTLLRISANKPISISYLDRHVVRQGDIFRSMMK